MKNIFSLTIAISISLLLSACGKEEAPVTKEAPSILTHGQQQIDKVKHDLEAANKQAIDNMNHALGEDAPNTSN
ncbi:hypothetical protein VQ643_09995 [Pseudomonas sp. F1_0610]|uniref:hypothetical protein n=1 Tax=Pseudomonas sp. F1_0610 TaxID=3114284 RepID=UPI0039C32B73